MERVFSQEAAVTFILILSRVAGIVATAPPFNSLGIPRNVKILFAFILALILYPSIPMVQTVPINLYKLVCIILLQVSYGLLVGLAIMLVFMALQAAGSLLDLQIGLGMAAMIDPSTGHESSLLARWLNLFAIMIFLGLNGHHWLLLGLINSFKLVSLEQSFLTPGFIEFTIRAFADILRVAFNIAAPVIIAVMLLDIVTGFIAKTAPRLNVLFLTVPFKISLGLFVLMLSLGSVMFMFSKVMTQLREPLLRLFYI